MKTRLNLTIDAAVVKQAKKLAAKQSLSLSQMVEEYLQKVSEQNGEVPLHIKLLGSLKPAGDIPQSNAELWAEYCEANREKYGF